MANGRKGKASKRKLDMREKSGKLARQIGDRIQELRERIKDGDGRPITQPAFYDFIFDKPEYQQSTDDPNEPKPEESKQTEISNIEGGKDISLALLCLISDKCGVSLDYLIRGKDYQPSAPTCPPEGKDASPAGDNVVESKTEKDSSTEMGSADLPPEFSCEPFLDISVNDICRALVALSRITDISIKRNDIVKDGLLSKGLELSIYPSERVYPVETDSNLTDENSPHYCPEYTGLLLDGESRDPDKKRYNAHIVDNRGAYVVSFLENILNIENMAYPMGGEKLVNENISCLLNPGEKTNMGPGINLKKQLRMGFDYGLAYPALIMYKEAYLNPDTFNDFTVSLFTTSL